MPHFICVHGASIEAKQSLQQIQRCAISAIARWVDWRASQPL
jgi:hypothetical protein